MDLANYAIITLIELDSVEMRGNEDGMIVKTKETEDLINKFEEYVKNVDLNKIEVK